MSHEPLDLPPDPEAAAGLVLDLSRKKPVLVFKKSPICPVSFAAEAEFRAWLKERGDGALLVAEIDVIALKPLARGLTAALGIRHESPQALFFRDGALVWHDSHDRLTRETFAARTSGA